MRTSVAVVYFEGAACTERREEKREVEGRISRAHCQEPRAVRLRVMQIWGERNEKKLPMGSGVRQPRPACISAGWGLAWVGSLYSTKCSCSTAVAACSVCCSS